MGARETMTDPGVTELLDAMRKFRARFACAQLAATYVGRDGELLILTVTPSLTTIGDDDGNLHLVEQ